MRSQNKLLLDQLDRKLKPFAEIKDIETPERGWIHTIRTTLNMTLRQLGERLGITSQGVKDTEEREASGSISLKSLREVANALNMKFIYGFAPKANSISEMVDIKANELARRIVLRTSHTMKLEDQGISEEGICQAVEELAEEIKREMRKSLWDYH